MKAEESKKAGTPADTQATTVIEGSELGEVKIHENVISTLVRKAALSVEGVSRLAGNALVDNIAEIVGSRRMQARAITVNLGDDNQVAVELKINILVGYQVPEVAEKVQRAVIGSVESVTGMNVTGVNVVIQDIEEPEAENSAGEAASSDDLSALPMN